MNYPRLPLYALIFGLALFSLWSQLAKAEVIILTSFPEEFYQRVITDYKKQYPDSTIRIINRKTTSAIHYIKEKQKPLPDLFWASSPDAFSLLKQNQLLKPITGKRSPLHLHPLIQVYTDSNYSYQAFALSGYGIMWNKRYLANHQLEVPQNWRDLTDAQYFGHIGMTTPSRSGTTHIIVESILQEYGWNEGWRILQQIAANLSTITARSFGVPTGVQKERFGLGLVIDFFALKLIAEHQDIDFTYPNVTVIPANVALLKSSNNIHESHQFIQFLLSDAGQKVLFAKETSRLPINPEIYRYAPDNYPNPFQKPINNHFNIELSQRRYYLVNSLFDHLITYQLSNTNAIYKEIYDIEKTLAKKNNKKASDIIEDIKILMTEIPITEELSLSKQFLSQFSSTALSLPQTIEQQKIEKSWEEYANKRSSTAYTLLSQVKTLLAINN